ncbi:MAG: CoA transferase [Actinobacteria bacterium]|nr:CoA transferase [Actinomycetota bacterium]
MAEALDGLRVLEIGRQIAATYATKLLCELGADVIKVEPDAGDPLRSWRDGVLFRYLNCGKRSVRADLMTDDARSWLHDNVANADLIIESLGAGGCEAHRVDLDELRAVNPALAIVRISDFGQEGPYVGIETSGLTLQALGGWVSNHGVPHQSPVQVGAWIHEYTAGTYAAAAALTAVRAAQQRNEPVTVDLSVMECLVGALPYPMIVLDDMLSAGRPPPSVSYFPLPGIVRCKDGWVGINCLTGQQFADACVMLGVDEYGTRQLELSPGGPPLDEFFARIQPWLDERTAEEIVEIGQAFRVPTAPVGDGRMMLDYAQFAERPFFVEEDGITMPGPPYRLSATPSKRRGTAPAIPSNLTAGFWARATTSQVVQRAENPVGLPFDGLRVLDLGSFWAGPYCTMYLGSFGAEVIKVESIRRPDGFRFSGAVPELGDDWYERGGIFAAVNLNKREVTLELSHEDGRALFLKLVEQADVVLENFSARVVEQFGLSYDALCTVKPDIIMVRMPGFGLEGPWRDYVGWAMVIEQATGMASVTGPPEVPMHPGGLADPVIGMHAAVAVQAALAYRERTGDGQLIEVAQLETGANVTAELIVEWSAHGAALPREGNRDQSVAPQGVYPCRADTPIPEWVAVTIADDDQWEVFANALDHAEWASDDALRKLDGRHARHDDLDAGIAAWTASRSPAEVVGALRPLGIPVAHVIAVPRMYHDPQLNAREWFVELDHAIAGPRRYPGWPMRFSFTDAHHRFGAPTLGQHNREILEELGLSETEIDRLERDGITGTSMTP